MGLIYSWPSPIIRFHALVCYSRYSSPSRCLHLPLGCYPLSISPPRHTMKLRIRALESKETIKIEVPNPCSLQQLKRYLFDRLSPSSVSPESLHLSLNSKDELQGASSAEDSIQSLGIASGDLIYYSLHPYSFSSSIEDRMVSPYENPRGSDAQVVETVELTDSSEGAVDGADRDGDLKGALKGEALHLRLDRKDQTLEFGRQRGVFHQSPGHGVSQKGETSGEGFDVDGHVIEMDEEEGEYALCRNDKYSVPSFLRRVFGRELADVCDGGDHRLLVIAGHAVLLESGFVCFDPITGMKVDGFHLPDERPSSAFTLSLHYTLPDILSSEVVETVVLKFQTLGKFVNVYGSLLKKGFGVHRVTLDESRFVPALKFVWKNREHINADGNNYDSEKTFTEAIVFEFWRSVKDGIALPLLIDLCDKAGLLPPPCFMRLPTELKLKILVLLSGNALAKMACVCTEMQFLTSNNDMWKQKYAEEFGHAAHAVSAGEFQWKARFGLAWESRKRVAIMHRRKGYFPSPTFWLPTDRSVRRYPGPIIFPSVMGGDYDRVPGLGRRPHFGSTSRCMSPNCSLGGFNA